MMCWWGAPAAILLPKTPIMGFSTWNHFAENIDEALIKEVADALVSLRAALAAEAAVRAGIEAAGYQCSLEAVAEPELSFADSETR